MTLVAATPEIEAIAPAPAPGGDAAAVPGDPMFLALLLDLVGETRARGGATVDAPGGPEMAAAPGTMPSPAVTAPPMPLAPTARPDPTEAVAGIDGVWSAAPGDPLAPRPADPPTRPDADPVATTGRAASAPALTPGSGRPPSPPREALAPSGPSETDGLGPAPEDREAGERAPDASIASAHPALLIVAPDGVASRAVIAGPARLDPPRAPAGVDAPVPSIARAPMPATAVRSDIRGTAPRAERAPAPPVADAPGAPDPERLFLRGAGAASVPDGGPSPHGVKAARPESPALPPRAAADPASVAVAGAPSRAVPGAPEVVQSLDPFAVRLEDIVPARWPAAGTDAQRGGPIVVEQPGVPADLASVRPGAPLTGEVPPTSAPAPAATLPDDRTGPASIAPRAVVEQLVPHLRHLERHGPQALHVRLDPPELGGVRVEALLERGELTLTIRAERESARELIARGLPELRLALADHGVPAARVHVELEGGGHGGRAPGGSEGGPPRRPPPPAPRRAASRVSSIGSATGSGGARVDLLV